VFASPSGSEKSKITDILCPTDMVYINADDIQWALGCNVMEAARVAARVAAGGHDMPADKIVDRMDCPKFAMYATYTITQEMLPIAFLKAQKPMLGLHQTALMTKRGYYGTGGHFKCPKDSIEPEKPRLISQAAKLTG